MCNIILTDLIWGVNIDNNKIIILLLGIIVAILLVGLAIVVSDSIKENSAIEIKSNEITQGSNFKFQLTGPMDSQNVEIILKDENNNETYFTVKTDSNGNGKLKIDESGKYEVTVKYSGNSDFKGCEVSDEVTVKATTSEVSEDFGGSEIHTITMTPKFDEYTSKTVGEYTVTAMKWSGTTVGGLDITLSKNGQMMDKNSYLSRGHILMDGQWKWTNWAHGEEDGTHHRYPVSSDVVVDEIEVQF